MKKELELRLSEPRQLIQDRKAEKTFFEETLPYEGLTLVSSEKYLGPTGKLYWM